MIEDAALRRRGDELTVACAWRLSSFDEVDVRVLPNLVEDDPASVGLMSKTLPAALSLMLVSGRRTLVARSSIQNSTCPVLAT